LRSDRRTGRGLTEETLFEHGPPPGAPLTPRLLANRPFLWLVLSSGVFNLGTWAYFAAVWADAAYRFDATPAQMSILLASFSVPFVLFVPIQGILVDRWSPKWLFIGGLLVGTSALIPAWMGDSLPALYLSSFLVGAGLGAVMPARSAMTGLLVPQRHLVQANGMLSGAVQASLIVGPLAGGLLLRSFGSGVVYTSVVPIMLLSAAIGLLVPDRRQGGERPALRLRELADGALTSWRIPELRLLLWLAGVAWMVVNVYWILQPLYAKDQLHVGGDAVAYMWSAQGAGAFVASVLLYRVRDGSGRELRFIGIGLTLCGFGFLGFAATSSYAIATVAMVVHGSGFSVFFSSSLALIQRLAGEEQRGRVTSIFAVLQEGTAIVAALIMVALGDLVEVRPSLLAGAVLIGAAGALGLVALRRLRRMVRMPGRDG
jgi:MFS family permease